MMTFKEYIVLIMGDLRSNKLDFNPDGRIHYVYRVSHKLYKTHYYGSKTEGVGITEVTIGWGYYTSSTDKDFQNDFKKNPHNYKIKIVRRFNNQGDNILFESYLHQKFDVKLQVNFINKRNQKPFGFDATGTKISEDTRKNMSEAQIKFNAEIAADPERYEQRRVRQSEAHVKRNAKIKADPEKNKLRSENMSKAAVKNNADLNADPEKYSQKIEKNREATTKSQAEILADPERALKRHIKLSKAASKIVYEYDLNKNFIREFSSQKEATEYYNIKNKSGITHCVTGRQRTCNNSIWSAVRLETQ